MSSQAPIAFFGATGGCANAALALALRAGYQCSALARTPSKLNDMLSAKDVPKTTIESNLQIVQGDVKDVETVKKVLLYCGTPVVKIISGIGMPPSLNPKNWDGTICQLAAQSILQAVREMKFEHKLFYVSISTTGISEGRQDVPLLMRPMYHYLLALPHADKRVVEQTISEAAAAGDISGYTLVRPAWLSDGASKGMQKIRVGDVDGPAVGYGINRDDVGLWIYEELVRGDASRWSGKKPSITY